MQETREMNMQEYRKTTYPSSPNTMDLIAVIKFFQASSSVIAYAGACACASAWHLFSVEKSLGHAKIIPEEESGPWIEFDIRAPLVDEADRLSQCTKRTQEHEKSTKRA